MQASQQCGNQSPGVTAQALCCHACYVSIGSFVEGARTMRLSSSLLKHQILWILIAMIQQELGSEEYPSASAPAESLLSINSLFTLFIHIAYSPFCHTKVGSLDHANRSCKPCAFVFRKNGKQALGQSHGER